MSWCPPPHLLTGAVIGQTANPSPTIITSDRHALIPFGRRSSCCLSTLMTLMFTGWDEGPVDLRRGCFCLHTDCLVLHVSFTYLLCSRGSACRNHRFLPLEYEQRMHIYTVSALHGKVIFDYSRLVYTFLVFKALTPAEERSREGSCVDAVVRVKECWREVFLKYIGGYNVDERDAAEEKEELSRRERSCTGKWQLKRFTWQRKRRLSPPASNEFLPRFSPLALLASRLDSLMSCHQYFHITI